MSGANLELAQVDAARARAASDDPAAGGATVRYLGSTLIPSDETCFVLFEAPSAHVLGNATRLAALAHARIVETVDQREGEER